MDLEWSGGSSSGKMPPGSGWRAEPRQDNDGVQRVFLNSADPGLDPCKKQAERERQAAGNNSCSCANNILTSNRIKGLFQPDQSWWLLAQCKN